jgi:hypothetical protein
MVINIRELGTERMTANVTDGRAEGKFKSLKLKSMSQIS